MPALWKHPRDLDFTLLCLAQVEEGEESFDELVLKNCPDARGICGMQWTPNGSGKRCVP